MEINNIFTHLVQEFCKEHIGSVIFIIIMSVSLGLIQTNGISEFTALLIDQIEGNYFMFWHFSLFCIIFSIIYLILHKSVLYMK